jgi:hypothetical protein
MRQEKSAKNAPSQSSSDFASASIIFSVESHRPRERRFSNLIPFLFMKATGTAVGWVRDFPLSLGCFNLLMSR